MGLQVRDESAEKSTYLAVAGGYVWNKKEDESHPLFKTQEFKKIDGTVGSRQGARYDSLTGVISGVEIKTHDQYGESIQTKIVSGGDVFTISISTNNRYSQDMMKALLKLDLSLPVMMRPYDFINKEDKRVQGIAFTQNGAKVVLRNDDAPFNPDVFTTGDKKKIKRFFEDLTEWFVDEVTSKVINGYFAGASVATPAPKPAPTPTAIPQREVKVEAKVEVEEEAKVDEDDLDKQLHALMS
jgi:hypothetical protein